MALLRHTTEAYESLQEFLSTHEDTSEEVYGTTDAEELMEKMDSELEAIQTVLNELNGGYLLDYDGYTTMFLVHSVAHSDIRSAYVEVRNRDEQWS